MFIFIRLLLAHFIADFPLQFNKIFEFKRKGLMGGIPHALVVAMTFTVFSWPYLNIPGIWILIYFFSLVHLFQDTIKLKYGNLKYSFWFYLLDQLFHIATIATILLLKLKDLPPPKENGHPLVIIYNSDLLMLYLIAIIVATYNGLYLIRSFKVSFFGRSGTYSNFEKWFGMLERTLIVSIFALGCQFFALLPFLLLLRPLIFFIGKRRIRMRKNFISLQEFSFSWIIATAAGFGLYIIMQRLS
jgi:hypothetical protein